LTGVIFARRRRTRKKILFFKIFLASFYRGHILTLIVLVEKGPKKL
jgi:hypothetical protein